MKLSLASRSLLLFGLSIFFVAAWPRIEPALAGWSAPPRRIVATLLRAGTPMIGAILGVLSLERKERPGWPALIGMTLNAFFGLYQLIVLELADPNAD